MEISFFVLLSLALSNFRSLPVNLHVVFLHSGN
jgi:hypothetical protein